MKLNHYIVLLFFILFSISDKIVAQTTPELLVGTWTFSYDASIANMDVTNKASFDAIPGDIKLKIEQNSRGKTITLAANGVYTEVLQNGQVNTATWALLNNQAAIGITDANGTLYVQEIKLLTTSGLVLEPKDLGFGKHVINQLYFTKN